MIQTTRCAMEVKIQHVLINIGLLHALLLITWNTLELQWDNVQLHQNERSKKRNYDVIEYLRDCFRLNKFVSIEIYNNYILL